MPIAICGVQEVPAFAAVPLDHIVSFRDCRQSGPDIQNFKHPFTLHSFVFDDTHDLTKDAPNEVIIKRLLNVYAQTNPNQNILFHCFAGVSRSSAAAFIWLVYHGSSYTDAYEAIVQIRGPFVSPNQLMVKFADQIMSHEGKMTAFVDAEVGRRAPEREAYFQRFK